MKSVGYLNIWGIDCTCCDNEDEIIVMPVDKEKIFPFSHIQDTISMGRNSNYDHIK